jgi:copper chaperone CopZ
MRRRDFLSAVAGLIVAAPVARAAQAPAKAPPKLITIKVSDMHCGSCAKKIARKLYAVPGVVKVQTDVSKHTATVTPQASAPPDLRLIWEAVEKSGFQPLLVTGPGGTLKAKAGTPEMVVKPHGPDESR